MKRNRQAKWMPRLALAVACLAALAAARAADIAWTNAAGGDFSNPLNWSPNQVPGPIDRAVFDIETPEPYTVTWSVPVTNDNFYVAKGKVVWNLNGKRYNVIKTLGISVYSAGFGTSGQSLDMVITNGTLNISSDYYRNIVGDTTVRVAANVSGAIGRYDSAGIGAGSRLVIDGARISAGGRLSILSAGELVVTNGGMLANFSNWTATEAGSHIRVSGGDSLYYTVLGEKNLYGELYIGKGAATQIHGAGKGTTIYGGLILDDGGLNVLVSPTLINELGTVEGQGVVTSAFFNAGGWVRPGRAGNSGCLMFKGRFSNYQNEMGGTLEIELGGTASGAFDRLVVVGETLYAGGTLAVSLIDDFKPATGDTFDILDFSAVDGAFETLDFPGSTANWDLSKLYTTGEIRYRPVGTVLMVR